MPPFSNVKVVILCGGQGTRMREETEYRPKPMVEVGGRPLLWHIMKIYAAAGLTDFVCCLGYRGAMIKQYFLEYRSLAADVSVEPAAAATSRYHSSESEDWNVTLVDTGDDAMTGARVKRVAHHLPGRPLPVHLRRRPGRRRRRRRARLPPLARQARDGDRACTRRRGSASSCTTSAQRGPLRREAGRRAGSSRAASSSSTARVLDRLSIDAALRARARAARGPRRATAS